jgi:hypothetical protein
MPLQLTDIPDKIYGALVGNTLWNLPSPHIVEYVGIELEFINDIILNTKYPGRKKGIYHYYSTYGFTKALLLGNPFAVMSMFVNEIDSDTYHISGATLIDNRKEFVVKDYYTNVVNEVKVLIDYSNTLPYDKPEFLQVVMEYKTYAYHMLISAIQISKNKNIEATKDFTIVENIQQFDDLLQKISEEVSAIEAIDTFDPKELLRILRAEYLKVK